MRTSVTKLADTLGRTTKTKTPNAGGKISTISYTNYTFLFVTTVPTTFTSTPIVSQLSAVSVLSSGALTTAASAKPLTAHALGAPTSTAGAISGGSTTPETDRQSPHKRRVDGHVLGPALGVSMPIIVLLTLLLLYFYSRRRKKWRARHLWRRWRHRATTEKHNARPLAAGQINRWSDASFKCHASADGRMGKLSEGPQQALEFPGKSNPLAVKVKGSNPTARSNTEVARPVAHEMDGSHFEHSNGRQEQHTWRRYAHVMKGKRGCDAQSSE